eukprot:COSAG02_NODE_2678_length_8262_cov_5.072400_5_plen_75_part_00
MPTVGLGPRQKGIYTRTACPLWDLAQGKKESTPEQHAHCGTWPAEEKGNVECPLWDLAQGKKESTPEQHAHCGT